MSTIHWIQIVPSEIWFHMVSSFLELEDLRNLRCVCRFLNDIFPDMYNSFLKNEEEIWKKKQKEFINKRNLWKEVRGKLTCEEKVDLDTQFEENFWMGIGSESHEGVYVAQELFSKGASAKLINAGDDITNVLYSIFRYDCACCNHSHFRLLRIAIDCGLDMIPNPSKSTYRDFDMIFVDFDPRNLFDSNTLGKTALMEEFYRVIEYILLAGKTAVTDYSTLFLHQVLGVYGGFQNELRSRKRALEGSVELRKERHASDMKKIRPIYRFRKILKVCLFYGADIYKPLTFDVHEAGNNQWGEAGVLHTRAVENCISRTFRMKDPYVFQFLVTLGDFDYYRIMYEKHKTMISTPSTSYPHQIDYKKLMDILVETLDHPCEFLKPYSLLSTVVFWRKTVPQVLGLDFFLEFLTRSQYFLFPFVWTQNRKFLEFVIDQAKELDCKKKSKEVDKDEGILFEKEDNFMNVLRRSVNGNGDSLLTYACGRRGVMWKIVELFVTNGWNLDHRNHKGETALVRAIQNRNVETLRILLKFGALLSLVDDENDDSNKGELVDENNREKFVNARNLLKEDLWLSRLIL